jgi:hypothetical protein
MFLTGNSEFIEDTEIYRRVFSTSVLYPRGCDFKSADKCCDTSATLNIFSIIRYLY